MSNELIDKSLEYWKTLTSEQQKYCLTAISKLMIDGITEYDNSFNLCMEKQFHLTDDIHDKSFDVIFDLWDLVYSGIQAINKDYI